MWHGAMPGCGYGLEGVDVGGTPTLLVLARRGLLENLHSVVRSVVESMQPIFRSVFQILLGGAFALAVAHAAGADAANETRFDIRKIAAANP